MDWQPIETAPKDNARPLYLARIRDEKLCDLDYDGAWDEVEINPVTSEPVYEWCSASGIEGATHWAYQDGEVEGRKWLLIDDAPMDNTRHLYIASFTEAGMLSELTFNGLLEEDSDEGYFSDGIVYQYWAGHVDVEEPTHFAYQDEGPPPPIDQATLAAEVKAYWERRINDSADASTDDSDELDDFDM